MGIWLTRMPRYEGMIRARLQDEGLPGDLVYLALIESGFSNTATSRAKAVGMWQFMKGTAQGLRPAGRLVGGRAARSVPRHRGRGPASQDLTTGSARSTWRRRRTTPAPARSRAGVRRLPDDDEADSLNSDATFFRLYDTKLLRRETKDYVPKLIAAARIAKEPTRYGFDIGAARSRRRYDSIVVPDHDRARRHRPAGRHHRRRDPRDQSAVPPAGDAARRVLGRADAAGPRAATEAAYAELPPSRRDHLRRAHVAAG